MSGNMKKNTYHSSKGHKLKFYYLLKSFPSTHSCFKIDDRMADTLSASFGWTSPRLQPSSCLLSFDIKWWKRVTGGGSINFYLNLNIYISYALSL